MKKLLIILFAIFIIPIENKAQKAGGLAYEIDDLYMHAGTSIGLYGYGYRGSRVGFSFPITVSVQYGFHEYLSAGGFIGLINLRHEYVDQTGKINYNTPHISFGGTGTFHYAGLLNENAGTNIDLSKFDLYISFVAGLEIRSISGYEYYEPSIGIIAGPFIGAKYMFNDKIGIFVEAGRNTYGWGTIGVSAKLN